MYSCILEIKEAASVPNINRWSKQRERGITVQSLILDTLPITTVATVGGITKAVACFPP